VTEWTGGAERASERSECIAPTRPTRGVFDNIYVSNKQTKIKYLTIRIRIVIDNINVTK